MPSRKYRVPVRRLRKLDPSRPKASAKNFPLGTTRKGKDGNTWKVGRDANGHTWVRLPRSTIVLSRRKSRPSPSESATLFPLGTVLKGNDGNLWKIIRTNTYGSRTKRWTRIAR